MINILLVLFSVEVTIFFLLDCTKDIGYIVATFDAEIISFKRFLLKQLDTSK